MTNNIKYAIKWTVTTFSFYALGGLIAVAALDKIFENKNLDGYFIVYIIAMVMVDLRNWVLKANNNEDLQ